MHTGHGEFTSHVFHERPLYVIQVSTIQLSSPDRDCPYTTEVLETGVQDVQLVDVREQYEWDVAKVDGFKLYPMSEMNSWLSTIANDLDPQKETLVLCKAGVRSLRCAEALVQMAGFTKVKNIAGGIDAYAVNIDPSVPRY